MAKATLLGSVLGFVISLPIYWWLGVSGIVPAMILTAIVSLLVSWWYARKIITEPVDLSFSQTFKEGLDMAKLGFFIVVNGFVATLAMYAIRSLIRSHNGLDSVGYFQAVWAISTMYINILLNAMLADYFPRLTMIHHDNVASNKLINEQLEMTLLFGAPMLMGMVVFAPLAIKILYSSSFYAAVPILKWQMTASFFTLISWPLGVLYLSKNKGWFAIISESIKQLVYITIVFLGWRFWGFETLGIGFLVANCIAALIVVYSTWRISDFHFSVENIKNIFFLGPAAILILFSALHLSGYIQYCINGVVLITVCLVCLKKVNKLLDIKSWIKAKKSGRNV